MQRHWGTVDWNEMNNGWLCGICFPMWLWWRNFFFRSQSTIGDVAAVAGAVVFSSVCFHNICISQFLRCYYVSFIVWSWLALLVWCIRRVDDWRWFMIIIFFVLFVRRQKGSVILEFSNAELIWKNVRMIEVCTDESTQTPSRRIKYPIIHQCVLFSRKFISIQLIIPGPYMHAYHTA